MLKQGAMVGSESSYKLEKLLLFLIPRFQVRSMLLFFFFFFFFFYLLFSTIVGYIDSNVDW